MSKDGTSGETVTTSSARSTCWIAARVRWLSSNRWEAPSNPTAWSWWPWPGRSVPTSSSLATATTSRNRCWTSGGRASKIKPPAWWTTFWNRLASGWFPGRVYLTCARATWNEPFTISMTWSSHSNWAIDLIRFDVGSCFCLVSGMIYSLNCNPSFHSYSFLRFLIVWLWR